MSLINNRIFIFGGFQEGGVLNDLYSIDVISWEWKTIQSQGPVPPPRQGMASARVGKKIYITGGCDYRQQQCYTDTYILDTDSLWWTKIEDNKNELTGRGDFSLIFYRGHLIAFGGCEMYKQCFDNTFIMNINDICPNKCSNKGECKETEKIGCVCNQGYTDHDCSLIIKCKEDCSKNGLCHNNGKCGCYPGWNGVICHTLIPCPNNCTDADHGICQKDSSCLCKSGFNGTDCSNILSNVTITPFREVADMQIKNLKIERNTTNNVTFRCPNDCSNHGKCDTVNKKCDCDVLL
jgi:hypothetical protein